MTFSTKLRLFVIAVLASAFSSACGSSDSTSPMVVPGNYSLQSVNGSLPYRIYHGDKTGTWLFDVTSGTLALKADNTFSEVMAFHVTPPPPDVPGDTAVTTAGTYAVHGGNITLTSDGPLGTTYSWNGTVAAGSLTYTDPQFSDVPGGIVAVYVK